MIKEKIQEMDDARETSKDEPAILLGGSSGLAGNTHGAKAGV
jgi:hypothetical protein